MLGIRIKKRRTTNIPSIFPLKLLFSKTRQATIDIETNPVDASGPVQKKNIVKSGEGLVLDTVSGYAIRIGDVFPLS